MRSGHRSGHFGEQGSGSRVLCQTRRDSIGRGTFARYVLLGLGIFTGGWVTIFYFIGDPRIGDPPPIGGRDRTRSIESNVEDQMLAILTLDLGPRDFGPTTGRDTLFHREMPGEIDPHASPIQLAWADLRPRTEPLAPGPSPAGARGELWDGTRCFIEKSPGKLSAVYQAWGGLPATGFAARIDLVPPGDYR